MQQRRGTTRRKKASSESHEQRTRGGQWTRTFSVRNECWGIIEHWASEHGYHLTAIKGKRRLYRKGYQQSFFLSFLDVKHDESQITFIGWIEVGFAARALSGFTLPRELSISPHGLNGILQRRQACRDFNLLLERLEQPPILGSTGFHIGDMDLSTVSMLGLFIPTGLFFIYSTSSSIEVRPGLAQALLTTAGLPLALLAVVAFILILAHHLIAIRKFNQLRWRALSVGIGSLLYLVLTLVLVSRTSSEMTDVKVTFDCVQHYQREACDHALSLLSKKDREVVLQRLQWLEQTLAVRPEHNGR